MFAVIMTGGKQYRVAEGDVIRVEKLDVADKKKVTFDQVLLLASEDGQTMKLGMPTVAGAQVTATVVTALGRSKKVTVNKFKNKTRYYKRQGHRQPYTEVKIDKIKG